MATTDDSTIVGSKNDKPFLPFLVVVLLLLLGITCSCSNGSLVKVNKGLKVRRGQSAYLQEGDLQFTIPLHKDACKVEVVLNEPITQRVGRFLPQVFNCQYRDNEVKYVHNGCPLLTEDTVKLRLYRFTDTDTHMEVFSLHVDIVEPECSIIKLGPKILEVSAYGISDDLDGKVVSFHYERRANLECSVYVNTHDTHLPAHGQLINATQKVAERRDKPRSSSHVNLQRGNKRLKSELGGNMKIVEFLKIPCDDFLVMGLKYRHMDPPSPDVDYVTIRLEIKDMRSSSVYKSEQIWIPIRINGTLANRPPEASFMPTFILEVDQFVFTPLSTRTLDADDDETPKEHLIFNITELSPTSGFIAHLSDHTRPIYSFTWLDLNDMLIGYQPPNSSHTQRRNYEMEIEVHDFYFKKSPPMTVHMSVRTADTSAPRVSWNMGISLLEGQSRPITWKQLQIVDNDNLDAVRIVAVDGLLHGKLTVGGRKGFMFTVSDIKAGFVCYHHDDSDSTSDFIVFRITDGRHHSRHKFPVKILPKDDSPPFLVANVLLDVLEGQTTLLKGSSLQASDMDSSNDYILFNITTPPRAGEIVKIPGPGLTGYPVSKFLQRDLSQSMIYYQHTRNEMLEDSFEVVLSDFHDPPNLSEPQMVMLDIESIPHQPPKEVPGAKRCLVVNETDVVLLTQQHLHFVDMGPPPDSDIIYTVTTPPFFVDGQSSVDAGRLFLVDSIPKFTKDANAPVLKLFTQHAINFMKVAYMSPISDIGPFPRHVQFVLSVTNQHGKKLDGICFNVTLIPVDNQLPQVITNSVVVDEGGSSLLGPEHLMVSDVDSIKDSLRLELLREPKHGALQLNGLPLKPGENFRLHDLTSRIVRYHHDNSETAEDNIEFAVTDGTNKISFTLQVNVMPINDEVPVLVLGLKPVLNCDEGHTVVITAEYICATDTDSDNNSLAFLIARQPSQGLVLRNGVVVDYFVQADIIAGFISYKHTGQEIGLTPHHDTITFVISDEQTKKSSACCGGRAEKALPVYDLHVTIFPVNSQPPLLKTGDLFVVDEGGAAQITTSHLKVSDEDTVLDELVITLMTSPQFGYLENVLPRPGFEKSNMGVSIDSFSYSDIIDGKVNYVQSWHQKTEPTTDQFVLCVSDGKFSSGHLTFNIVVKPTNDEIPEFVAKNITVQEGGMKHLDLSVFHVVDMDVPENVLLFRVVKHPHYGSINRHQGAGFESDVVDFTMMDLTNGKSLMYAHDNSESQDDSFTVQLTDGRYQIERQVMVKVLPVNDEKPHLIRNIGLEVEPGEARLITSVTLFAQDYDTPSSQVLYELTSVPTKGVLQIMHAGDWVTLIAGGNCTQEMVDMNRLRYVHQDLFGNTMLDFFVFCLNDGRNQSPLQRFNISILHVEKGDIAVFVRPVNVSRGDRVVLTTDTLVATDGTDKSEELVFIVTAPPAHGYLENIKRPGVAISNFSQMDVAANLLAYVHDKSASTSKEIIQFVVSNKETSRKGVLEVAVTTADCIPPSLSNKGLIIPRGFSMILSPDHLAMSDLGTSPGALTFRVLHPPQHGILVLHDIPLTAGSNFTQRDVEELEVTYKHNGEASELDGFEFIATDGANCGVLLDGQLKTEPLAFTIQIKSVDTSHPEVMTLLPLWKTELLPDGRYGIFLSLCKLKTKASKEEQLIFSIIRQPYFGYLENMTTGGFARRRISQKELKMRTVVYIIDPKMESLTDTLEFKVSDPQGNTGPSHILQLSWSSVALSQSEYSVCEDDKTVSVEIIRKGYIAESSYITVKVKEVTAMIGKDFLLSASSLVQFDPGVFTKIWKIELLQDQLEEAGETFEVVLVQPEGTIIGTIQKAQVTINDSGRGRCEDNHEGVSGKAIQGPRYSQYSSLGAESVINTRENGKIQVDDDASLTKKWKKANIRVVSRPRKTPTNHGKSGLVNGHATSENFITKPCLPKLMGVLYFNQTTKQIFQCSGVTWTSWAPTDQDRKTHLCARGWTFHNGHCYVLVRKHKTSWSTANRNCKERYKGTLVSVLSKRDMDWLWDFGGRRPFWIGLNNRDGKGSWEWLDGATLKYTNWMTRAPPVRSGQKCVLVWRRAKWQIRDCKTKSGHNFICSVKI
ncbi:FRAS1-related extracellular matrix protein 1a [Dunckerocampus dactyliophorus]|uniref:FRAS1-related extracellular matrix protein 1a n=1 Tax=Dunckerocampus dactyliophorus TaxID=161453 RepID=UPI0024049420|nr:FRAS1-related extracellular matrix protein 1a [Dunckerocampus dactyliophorus]